MEILLTGACGGLGKALVQQLVNQHPEHLVLWLTDRDDAQLTQFCEQLATGDSKGRLTIRTLALDLCQEDASERLQRWLEGARLTLVFNNAGIASGGAFDALPEAEWQRCLEVNLMAAIRVARSSLPYLGRGSTLINIASMAAIANAPFMAAYNVSKAALLSLSETLRLEWQPKGIQVSVVCPAFFDTPLLDSLNQEGQGVAKVARKMMTKSELSAEDVAGYILKQAQRGEFMILPHGKSRQAWRLKRWLPEQFYKIILKQSFR
ncbi:SDR family NAD(P)-dependent oxidoreductase [Ferrimonas aestuarii]|uniref:SDR family NAD(P)-dependent oxidoreductase n=1 Tax=Ferrimonas aestuarii TaxID=2569539 RepID=A0A4U1BKB6_9GAMM|nr:SDR family NAD(P)-dependent oxidoreductase [Ferrimonas aestuarii]TKB51646.1 SDR family NAD(P)-dependent oxidoreductase [Ferrimonas aestuarii]